MNEDDHFVKLSQRVWNDFGFLKGIKIPRQGQSGPKVDVEFCFDDLDKRKEANRYYLETRDKSFLHFTSKAACISVLHERAFRLYNLHNSADLEEYAFTADMFDGHLKFSVDLIKENSFILSLTDVSDLTSSYHWDNYADQKNGVAIELEFKNHETDWDAFYLSPVYYGELEEKDSWKEKIESIQKDFSFLKIEYDPSIPFVYQKNIGWSKEREIRLGSVFPFSTYKLRKQAVWNNSIISKDFHSHMRNGKIKFLPVHLYTPDTYVKNYIPDYQVIKNFPGAPEIEIKRIWLHPEGEDSKTFIDLAREMSGARLGYPILPEIVSARKFKKG